MVNRERPAEDGGVEEKARKLRTERDALEQRLADEAADELKGFK